MAALLVWLPAISNFSQSYKLMFDGKSQTVDVIKENVMQLLMAVSKAKDNLAEVL